MFFEATKSLEGKLFFHLKHHAVNLGLFFPFLMGPLGSYVMVLELVIVWPIKLQYALGFYHNKCLLKQIGEQGAINNILGYQL
jgi:hypothetical protein